MTSKLFIHKKTGEADYWVKYNIKKFYPLARI